ncbi:MAG TPA: carbonic anhydrase [Verrucomicrobiae bacterium]|nr:carbonic anhydrase [Verrucomicrobiae bacterium]
MRLFEAIIEANQRLAGAATRAPLQTEGFADALPIVALTCIDPRLNRLIPEALGVPEEHFIWSRNAGNIITGPLSSTMRSLALACAVKGGKEIAVIGHSDCLVCKTTVMSLTDGFRKLGVDRLKLPENLNEYFGLFASERQNVIRGAEIVRQSPLIGSNVPVHGLLVDIATGRLEWLVNGYQTLGTPASSFAEALKQTATDSLKQTATEALGLLSTKLQEFKIGEMKFPEIKIGDTTIDPNKWLSQVETIGAQKPEAREVEAIQKSPSEFERKFDRSRKYKIIGLDQKVYGPIGGFKILEWIADGRMDWQTPSQMEGSGEWKPLSSWADAPKPPQIPLPPPVKPQPKLQKSRRH